MAVDRRSLNRMIAMLAIMAAALLALGVPQLLALLAKNDTPEPLETTVAVEPDINADDTALYKIYDGELLKPDGKAVTLSDMRGKKVMLVFWSSWCDDCKTYMKDGLLGAIEAARSFGLEAHIVCREGRHGETRETAEMALAEFSFPEPTLMDMNASLFDKMGLKWVPTVAVLDESGRLMVAATGSPGERDIPAMIEAADGKQLEQSERFLLVNLLDASGAVCSTYDVQGNAVIRGNVVLSETEGLMMQYAVRKGDKALFDKLLSFVRNNMTVGGLTAWRNEDGANADVNASFDDLRIADALFLADEKWDGYAQELGYRASSLYRACVIDGHFRDYAVLDSGEPTRSQTLCYLDIAAMERIAGAYGKWSEAAANARTVLKNAVISAEFPLFYPKYDPENNKYAGDSLQMNEALITVLNAVNAGIDCAAALDWLEAEMAKGGIYARYDLRGYPVRGYVHESTATYALLAQAAMAAGRVELTQKALARMERRRCFTPPMAGGMGRITDAEHSIFDLVQAVLAWQEHAGRGMTQ